MASLGVLHNMDNVTAVADRDAGYGVGPVPEGWRLVQGTAGELKCEVGLPTRNWAWGVK
jgi:hypothetical protein